MLAALLVGGYFSCPRPNRFCFLRLKWAIQNGTWRLAIKPLGLLNNPEWACALLLVFTSLLNVLALFMAYSLWQRADQ